MDSISRTILKSVLSLPTMSFHETAVSTFVRWYAAGIGLSVSEDRAGNLLVQYPPLCKGRAGRGRPQGITFAAHMDHPGFEVISSHGKKAIVAQWGKVDLKIFGGSRVIVHTEGGKVRGKIGKKPLKKKYLGRATFELKTEKPVSKGDFGAFDVPALKFSNGIIHTIAADNLISVAAVLDLLTRFAIGKPRVNVTALFTRGEEAGFLGAFAAMESKFIPKEGPLVVLECSSAKGGGVEIGGGPVVRAGDLQSTYDPEVEVWMSGVASSITTNHDSRTTSHDFKYQRALLQGGRCEACVYVAEGYKVGGIAMPLGNYHNQTKNGYAAEYVSERDYENYVKLLAALAHHPMKRGTMRAKVAPIWKHYRELKKKLMISR